jgi:hypothetical protein
LLTGGNLEDSARCAAGVDGTEEEKAASKEFRVALHSFSLVDYMQGAPHDGGGGKSDSHDCENSSTHDPLPILSGNRMVVGEKFRLHSQWGRGRN